MCIKKSGFRYEMAVLTLMTDTDNFALTSRAVHKEPREASPSHWVSTQSTMLWIVSFKILMYRVSFSVSASCLKRGVSTSLSLSEFSISLAYRGWDKMFEGCQDTPGLLTRYIVRTYLFQNVRRPATWNGHIDSIVWIRLARAARNLVTVKDFGFLIVGRNGCLQVLVLHRRVDSTHLA